MNLGLSLAGGGVKGIAHIGAIKALEEEYIKFNIIAGTSSGSIVATLYAVGFNTDEIYAFFEEYAKQIRYVDFKNIKKFAKDLIFKHKFIINGLNSGESIYRIVNKECNKKGIYNINQIKMPLIIPAVDICNEDLYVFHSKGVKNIKEENVKYVDDANIGTVVQASCSYPGIFSPCDKYKNTVLVDGGIEDNFPWRETKRAGADKVLTIAFEENDKEESCDDSLFGVLNKSFKILYRELSKYELDGTDYLLKIRLNKRGLLDYKNMNEIYNEGYIQTKIKINEIKEKLNI